MVIRDRATSFEGYEVGRTLGRGGMGVVYEAVQASLHRRVALKVLRPELAEDPEFVERFRREARLQASIEHPNVLDVYEVGESAENGLYLAMRLIDGPTLDDLLRDGRLDAERALRLLDQVAAALDAAHAAGLVHRDIKPQNILVGDDDHAFLADFGLSRAGADPATSTRPMMGTVAYVAPEVIHGEAPVPASDRYAFAATLFHCLTGDVVFPRGSDAAVLYAHVSDPPPRISERREGLPRGLDRVFESALAKDPDERPASARGLVAAVREELGARAIADLGAPDREAMGGTAGETLPTPTGPTRAPAASSARGPRWIVLVAVAVAAAALGAGVVAALQPEEDPPEVPVPAVPADAQALGSDLGLPDRSLECRGAEPSEGPTSCAIVQSELAGAQLLVPADGAIVGWTVRGADGELALDVIRPGGEETTRVARSQWESAGNAAPHHFRTRLAVERGDLIGLELGPGAAIGVAEGEGAETERWLEPKGGIYGSPDLEPGTGFDYELLLRADFVPGAGVPSPEQLTGAEAAAAPDGSVRRTLEVEISKPPATVTVEVVEVGGRVAVDLLRGGRRLSRVFIPGLLPGGQPIDVKAYVYEGEEVSEVDLWWVNPNSGRAVFHFLNVSRRQIQFLG